MNKSLFAHKSIEFFEIVEADEWRNQHHICHHCACSIVWYVINCGDGIYLFFQYEIIHSRRAHILACEAYFGVHTRLWLMEPFMNGLFKSAEKNSSSFSILSNNIDDNDHNDIVAMTTTKE